MKQLVLVTLISIMLTNCGSQKIRDIEYQSIENPSREGANRLNVFIPNNLNERKVPVLIFIHGGYWEEGNKDIYGFLGRNFAKHDVVTVIPNYRLSPNASYNEMANDVVKIIRWTQDQIEEYGGDSNQIYLMGHSAGGHLIALVVTNPKYGIQKNTIKGVILNDAAGLDMKSYLETYPPSSEHNYDITWTTNPENWRDASPVYFLDADAPPFLMYVGEKTYPSIIQQNKTFLDKLHKFQPNVNIHYLNKNHVPMMSHYFFPWVDRYDEILEFMGY
ncbi:MAG: alpha/beta hydrolase [Aquaticitalea sp.]